MDTSADTLSRDIAEVLIARSRIARRVGRLARDITRVYAETELTILAVLTGSLVFLSDLIRRLPLKMQLELVSVESYPRAATESRGPVFKPPLSVDLAGRDVLVVDDILDSGQTLKTLMDTAAAMNPASLRTCVLLEKARADLPDRIAPDFVGFRIDRKFVVGYGLDFDNLYRNLPDVCALKVEVFRRHRGGEGDRP